MVRIIKKRITASSLIEVLVALLIIMIVFAIASKIYLNSFIQVPSYTKIAVNQQLDDLMLKAKAGTISTADSISIDSITYHFRLTATAYTDSLNNLEITAKQQQKIIGKLNGLVPKTSITYEN